MSSSETKENFFILVGYFTLMVTDEVGRPTAVAVRRMEPTVGVKMASIASTSDIAASLISMQYIIIFSAAKIRKNPKAK